MAAKKGIIKKNLDPKFLRETEFFMLYPEHAMRKFCDDFFKKHHIKPKIKMEFPSNITCYRMAATGMAAAIVPLLTTQMIDLKSKIEIFSLSPEKETWNVCAFYRREAYIGEPELFLIRTAQEIFS